MATKFKLGILFPMLINNVVVRQSFLWHKFHQLTQAYILVIGIQMYVINLFERTFSCF